MIIVFISALLLFNGRGLGYSLIRKISVPERLRHGIFNLLAILVLYTILFILAGSISEYFNDPKLIVLSGDCHRPDMRQLQHSSVPHFH